MGSVPGTGAHWSNLWPNRVYESGRICEVESCNTRLSVYNPDPRCALHVGEKDPGDHLGDVRW